MYWKITDFTEELNRQVTGPKISKKTVDYWFRRLEKEGIHYVNRSIETNERIFDDLDLQIAIFIKQKRNENWLIASIFHEVKNAFSVRSLPQKSPPVTIPQVASDTQIPKELISELVQAMEQVAAAQVIELKKHFEQMLLPHKQQLPAISKEEEREKKFQEMVLRKRIEYNLEQEALKLWANKPLEERMIRTGLFRKEEDRDKRELFVREYVYKHFEERLREVLLGED